MERGGGVVSGEYLFIVAFIFYPNLMASRIGGFRRFCGAARHIIMNVGPPLC